MANCIELRTIAKARLKSVEALITVGDWHGSAYMLGYVLECALKAATCKTLHLIAYPENTKNDKINSYFMTHRFEQLLVVSGLENVFSSRGPKEAWQNWSEFTLEYPGDWPAMRYDLSKNWDKIKIEQLYNNLMEPTNGILTIIKRSKKW